MTNAYKFNKSLLLCQEGTILLNMGEYNQSLEAYDKALNLYVHHKYYFNKAAALNRLGQVNYAKLSIQQAIDSLKASIVEREHRQKKGEKLVTGDREILKKDKAQLVTYKKIGSKIQISQRPLIWWEWWIRQESLWFKILGAFLSLLLIILIALPLIIFPLWITKIILPFGDVRGGKMSWDIFVQLWPFYITPVIVISVMLLSPTIRRVSSAGVDIEPSLPSREFAFDPLAIPSMDYNRKHDTTIWTFKPSQFHTPMGFEKWENI